MRPQATPSQYIVFLAVVLLLCLAAAMKASRERRETRADKTVYRYPRSMAYLLLSFSILLTSAPIWYPALVPQGGRVDSEALTLFLLSLPGVLIYLWIVNCSVVVDSNTISRRTPASRKTISFGNVISIAVVGEGRYRTLQIVARDSTLELDAYLVDFRRLTEDVTERHRISSVASAPRT